jgi:hypothetical protein
MRQELGPFAGGVVIMREQVPQMTSERLADRIREYGITPVMCDRAREKGDKLIILVRGAVPHTDAEVQDLYGAKLRGYI